MKKVISNTALVAISAMLTVISVGVEAGGYGGVRSATKVCKAPKLKYKTPEAKAAINPGDSFSAQASKNIHKESVQVSIKGAPVDVTLTETSGGGYIITGQWPTGVEGDFARIKVLAKDKKGCKLSDGWLLQNGGAKAAAPAEADTDETAAAESEAAPAEADIDETTATESEAATE